ncbi:hypothetical protein [uncultured Kocuria sp.]|uniref:hypothetical protein n=1 Tax=uncultured Kocuria sp. TaxID=259305 RepID=UPI002591F33B|nr:hypothetical protein [uncultured Kocuria sp.]
MTPIHELTQTVVSLEGVVTLTTLVPITYGLATGIRTAASRLFRRIPRCTGLIMGLASMGTVLAGLVMMWSLNGVAGAVPFRTVPDLFYNSFTGFTNLAPEHVMNTAERQEWVHDSIKLLASAAIGSLVLLAAVAVAASGSLIDKADSLRSLVRPKPQTENA